MDIGVSEREVREQRTHAHAHIQTKNRTPKKNIPKQNRSNARKCRASSSAVRPLRAPPRLYVCDGILCARWTTSSPSHKHTQTHARDPRTERTGSMVPRARSHVMNNALELPVTGYHTIICVCARGHHHVCARPCACICACVRA